MVHHQCVKIGEFAETQMVSFEDRELTQLSNALFLVEGVYLVAFEKMETAMESQNKFIAANMLSSLHKGIAAMNKSK